MSIGYADKPGQFERMAPPATWSCHHQPGRPRAQAPWPPYLLTCFNFLYWLFFKGAPSARLRHVANAMAQAPPWTLIFHGKDPAPIGGPGKNRVTLTIPGMQMGLWPRSPEIRPRMSLLFWSQVVEMLRHSL